MYSLTEDLSLLTTIPVPNINKLLGTKSIYCICSDVEETALQNKQITEIDIGIGTLTIFVDDESIQYRFTPSKKLENSIKKTIINKHNPLVEKAEQTLTQRIVNTYKDYI